MATQVAPISQDQLKKWGVAIQEFVNEVFKKYPGLDSGFIPVLLEEIRALGLEKEYISSRSLWACFRNCVGDDRIKLPVSPKVDVADAASKLAAQFPPVLTGRQLAKKKRDLAASAGISKQTGRKSHAEKEESGTTAGFSGIRKKINLLQLKAEYKQKLSEAETATVGNTHASNFAERKRLKAILDADRRYDPVRDLQ
jgi:hypothetical protein